MLSGRSIHPLFWVVLGLTITLLLFCGKAVHIDDPLFLWTAERIQSAPADFFGFQINWWGTDLPMKDVMFNPPTTSYYLALVAKWFGWGEWGLHVALILPALLTVIGIYQLASQWCDKPVLTALLSISAPVFLVSATTLMCDVPMLMFWIWAIALWEKGLQGRGWWLGLAGLLAGLAILTKFSAVLLWPIMLLATLLRRHISPWSAVGLILPLLMLWWFEATTAGIYGKGLFALASDYAASKRTSSSRDYLYQLIGGLSFLGGTLAGTFFFAGFLWSRRALLAGGGVAFAAILGLCLLRPKLGSAVVLDDDGVNWWLLFQVGLWGAWGMGILALVFRAWLRTRNPVNTLLATWIIAGLLFATVFNWTVSARSFLILAPAVALLVVRELPRDYLAAIKNWECVAPLTAAMALAISVAVADYRLANSTREIARQLAVNYQPDGGRPLWFLGHWGFQYYMQKAGATAVDLAKPATQAGDWLVIPHNNTGVGFFPKEFVAQSTTNAFRPSPWLATMNPDAGAGFYSCNFGPLIFFVGPVPAEVYYVQRLARPIPAVLR